MKERPKVRKITIFGPLFCTKYRRRKTVATAGRSYVGPSESLRGFWGGIFRSCPLTSQKLPLCGNHQTQRIGLEGKPRSLQNYSELSRTLRAISEKSPRTFFSTVRFFIGTVESTSSPIWCPPGLCRTVVYQTPVVAQNRTEFRLFLKEKPQNSYKPGFLSKLTRFRNTEN